MDPLKNSAPVAPLDPVSENRRRTTTPAPTPAAQGRSGAAPASENVTLSQTARLLAAASTVPATQGGASPAKLTALKESIAAGTYGIDRKLIARSLIRDNVNLLTATPPSSASTETPPSSK